MTPTMTPNKQPAQGVLQAAGAHLEQAASALWHLLTEPPERIREPEQRRQARLLSGMLVTFILVGLVALAVSLFLEEEPLGGALRNSLYPIGAIVIIILIINYGVNRAGYYTIPASLPVVIMYLGIILMTSYLPKLDRIVNGLSFLTLCVLWASVFLTLKSTVAMYIAALAGIVLFPLISPYTTLADIIRPLISVGMIGSLIIVATALRQQETTERKRAEEKYRKLFENAPGGAYQSTLEGKFLTVNPLFVSMFGYDSMAEMLELDIARDLYVYPEHRDSFIRKMQEDGEIRDVEITYKRKDGQIFVVIENAHAIRDEQGMILYYQGTMTDITLRKRAEEQLQRYAEELEQRNEELDTFAHTAAHDLRNPLTAIDVHTNVLKLKYPTLSGEEIESKLDLILNSARKMTRIINELLLLAQTRKGEITISPLDMDNIVLEVQQRLIHDIEAAQATITTPDTWPPVSGYAPWIEEIWVNYISNAIKYGGDPPHIQLGATVQEDNRVRFWVRDNGLGLAPEDQARLFTPFTSLDQSGAKGYGLGLSIVRRIAEKLGGQVSVESEVGKGSVFSFTLPSRGPIDVIDV